MRSKKLIVIISVALSIPVVLYALIHVFAGAGREVGSSLPKGNIDIPFTRSIHYNKDSQLQEEILDYWSNGELSDWVDGEKVDLKNPRTVLGCLLAGERIEEINQYLMKQKATGTAGSRWLLNPKGGYNFTTMAFTPLLYLFDDKPELLFPETKKHLVNNILTIEGAGFTRNVPYLGFQDSENHVLMAESSRYLKNQWLRKNGNQSPEYDNENNGVEEGLKNYLQEIYTYGVYEFNSDPYLGYTYASLMNLNEFATGEVKELAINILDMINWQYALNSFQFKHFPPYRRRFKDAFSEEVNSDYHTVMLKVWASLCSDTLKVDISRGYHHALWATMMSYRPPDKVMEWTLQKPGPYFVKMGHGHNSCPEIASGDRSYLLTAGGANQGRRSLIMSKPIVLFLNDEARMLKEIFHMYGPGEDFMDWNNTGVYRDFACAKGKVHIPEGKQPLFTLDGWQVFHIADGIYLNIYSETALGLMVIVRAGSAEDALHAILENNPDKQLYRAQFTHPDDNFIEYDLEAPKDTWVIKKVNNEPVDRKFERWPFFEGNIDGMDKNSRAFSENSPGAKNAG